MDAPQVQRAGKIALVVGLADKISARVGTALGIFTDYKGFLDWTIDSLSKAVLAMNPDTALILIGVGILLWGQFGDWVRARIGHVRPIRARLVAGSRETTPSPPDTVTLTPVGREPTALAPRLVEMEAASVGLRRDIERLGEETVACREVVKALRPWIAELARVQITVAKVAALHRLPADAPHPPEAGDRANAEAMEGFSQEVARYLSIVLATSRQWSLPDLDHCEA